MRAEGKTMKDIHPAIVATGVRTMLGTPPSPGTIYGWLPRTYIKRRRAAAAVKPEGTGAAKLSADAQKLYLLETILRSSYMKAEDRISAALLML